MLEPTIYYTQSQHGYYYTIDARTHDLLHSKSAHLLVGSGIDSIIVIVLTLSVVDRGFEHRWCNSKRQSQHGYYYTIDSRTHDLLHSK
jgi:hypothetical protein